MEKIYRKDKIVEICRNKKVLHMGFIQHSHLYKELMNQNKWLHEKINEISKELVGIDYLHDDIEWFKKNTAYEVYFADVTKLDNWDYKDTFDVIICGELIEHLDNPGLMLEGVKQFMHQDSKLILTSPNPWSRNRIRLIKKQKKESEWINPEHTCWFSFQTLKQILDRCGYKELDYTYYFGEEKGEKFPVKNKFMVPLTRLKQRFIMHTTPELQYTGLFFQAKLS